MLRKMRRKIITTLLLCGVVLGLAACGDTDRDETSPELTLDTSTLLFLRQDPTVDLVGTIEAGSRLEIDVEAPAVLESQSVEGTNWQARIVELKEGANSIVLTAEDGQGNLSNLRFTIVKDTTAPTVAKTLPADAATDVPLDALIQVTFSEAVNPDFIRAVDLNQMPVNFYLEDANGPVEGTVQYTAGALLAVFKPTILTAGTVYTVTLDPGITDLVGLPLAAESITTWTFTTAP
ncbi:MAG: Ig-like domain-containing protein [Desulfuromonadales bacterium]